VNRIIPNKTSHHLNHADVIMLTTLGKEYQSQSFSYKKGLYTAADITK
jgi:hypothetical protein